MTNYAHFSSGEFTPTKLSRFLLLAREPWREYGARKPDDMPPKAGDKRALARIMADPDIEREQCQTNP
jgi:hypothetical protein